MPTGPSRALTRLPLAAVAFLALADTAIVALALPPILLELDTDVAGVAAVLGVYAVVLAAALLPAERLGPRVRHPRARPGRGRRCSPRLAGLRAGRHARAPADRPRRAGPRRSGAAGDRPRGPGRSDRRSRRRTRASALAPWPRCSARPPGRPSAARSPRRSAGARSSWSRRPPPWRPCPAASRRRRDGRLRGAARGRRRIARSLSFASRSALVSGAIAAALFLTVLLLISGWGIEPLAAALVVSVMPLSALAAPASAARRASARPWPARSSSRRARRRSRSCPTASVAWTILPQLAVGIGMGLALAALAGELLPDRDGHESARLLTMRHAGIALALLILAPDRPARDRHHAPGRPASRRRADPRRAHRPPAQARPGAAAQRQRRDRGPARRARQGVRRRARRRRRRSARRLRRPHRSARTTCSSRAWTRASAPRSSSRPASRSSPPRCS